MSGWGCVHESGGHCTKVAGRPCDPGMKGCVLAGRFRFTNPNKNRRQISEADNEKASASSLESEKPDPKV